MYSSNEIVFASFVLLQAGVWPTTVQGWATLVAPTSILLGFAAWLVNRFIISPLKQDIKQLQEQDIATLRTETRKSVRALRRMTQTYVGRVGVLEDNLRDCGAKEDTNARKIAGVESRITQVESEFREVQTELRDIKNLIEYKVLEKLEELSRNNPERGLK